MTTPQHPEWQSGDAQDPGPWHGQQPQYQPPPPYDPQYQPAPPYQPTAGYEPQYAPEPPYGYGAPVPPATPPARSRGRLIGASAAVVILAGGGVATYVAFSSTDAAGGAANPRAAVEQGVTDLNNSDLAGFLDDLAPGERDAISAPFNDAVHKLQDTKVLNSDASLEHINGVDVSATGFTYADQTITVNDHVQIVQLTGGTLHVSADASKLPFTSEFLHAVAPDGLPADSKVDRTVDIGDAVRRSGKPIRIAAQKVDGRWYPSLFYTIADYATHGATPPTAAERIPDAGAASADDAVRQLVQHLLGGEVPQALALLSPDELAVVHDYGKLIVDRAHYSPVPVTLKDIEFSDTAVSGGTRVVLKRLDLVDPNDPAAHEIVITNDGSCFGFTAEQHTKRFCAADMIAAIDNSGLGGSGASLTAEQRTALTDLFGGLTQVAGVITTQHDGKWYVNPVRSYVGLTGSLLSGLHGDDLLVLARLLRER